jgi:hypothetical protein
MNNYLASLGTAYLEFIQKKPDKYELKLWHFVMESNFIR